MLQQVTFKRNWTAKVNKSWAYKPEISCWQSAESYNVCTDRKRISLPLMTSRKYEKDFIGGQINILKWSLDSAGQELFFKRNNTISFSFSTLLWAWNHVRTKTLICMGRAFTLCSFNTKLDWWHKQEKQDCPNFLTLKYQNHWKTLCAIIRHVTIYNNHTKFESN